VREPKLESDKSKLRELCKQCRHANFVEARAIAVHWPHLLSLTDKSGFGPLHHAEMSGDPHFVAQILKLYKNPRTFPLKFLRYETPEDLILDYDLGFTLRLLTDDDAAAGKGVVGSHVANGVPDLSRASRMGVMAGDVLEAVTPDGAVGLTLRHPPPLVDGREVFDVLIREMPFPLTLEMRGSGCCLILQGDGWTPAHGAAGMAAAPNTRRVLANLVAAAEEAVVAQDVCGFKPKDWFALQKEHEGYAARAESEGSANSRPASAKRTPPARPLSAGPRGVIIAKGFQEGSLHPVSRPSSAKTRPHSACSRPVSAPMSRPTSATPTTRPSSAMTMRPSSATTRPGSAKSRADCESLSMLGLARPPSGNDGIYRVWEERCNAAQVDRVRDPEANSTRAENIILKKLDSCPETPCDLPAFPEGQAYCKPVS